MLIGIHDAGKAISKRKNIPGGLIAFLFLHRLPPVFSYEELFAH